MKISVNSLIESLSAIHRLLILTSLGLVVALLLTVAPDTLTNAKKDILAIQRMSESWNPNFLERLYLDQFTDRDVFYEERTIRFKKEYLVGLSRDSVAGPIELSIRYPQDIFTGWKYSDDGQHVEEPVPNTVAEFAALWEKSINLKVTQVYGLYGYAYVQTWKNRPEVEKIDFEITNGDSANYSEDLHGSYGAIQPNLLFNPDTIDLKDRDIFGLTIPNSNKGYVNWFVWIPMVTLTENAFWNPESPYVVTNYLCKEMGIVQRQGPFEESFSDLYLATKDLQNIPFNNLLILFEQERANRGSGFEFFGVKLPVAQINGLGAILLTTLIALFYMYLYNFRKAISGKFPEISSVWIGIFEDSLSKLATIVSLAVFPAITVIALSAKAIYDQYVWVSSFKFELIVLLLIIPPILSIVLSINIIAELFKTWKHLASAGSPTISNIVALPSNKTRNKKTSKA